MVEFDTESGGQVTIFFEGTLTVQRYMDNQGGGLLKEVTCVIDGRHNNGGWKVKGTYPGIVDKILYAKVI